MPFTTTVHHGLPYLLVEAAGPASLADLCGCAEMVASIAGRAGYRRALIDMTEIEVALSFTDHLQLGTHVAGCMAQLERVATVVTPANRKGTSEKAARKMGLDVKAFTERGEALAWIDSPS